ncbi:hypothetical protein P9112_007711 [Eukaryota sp. TZLM1-RC]
MQTLSSFDVFGFDLDHTLVTYKHSNLCSLIHSCLVRYLVEFEDFPTSVLHTSFNNVFCRGVLLDSHSGNVLFIGGDKSVLTAYHGKDFVTPPTLNLTSDEILFSNPRFFPVPTLFERPLASVFSVLVSLHDDSDLDLGSPPSEDCPFSKRFSGFCYSYLLAALLRAMHFNFASFHNGFYYPAFMKNPNQYVNYTPEIGAWIKSLQNFGKVVLITNSTPEYAKFLLSSCLELTDLDFDCCVYSAGKPKYWKIPDNITKLVTAIGLENFIMLYFGDHPVGDVIVPKGDYLTGGVSMKVNTTGIVENLKESDINEGFPSFQDSFFYLKMESSAEFIVPSLSDLVKE